MKIPKKKNWEGGRVVGGGGRVVGGGGGHNYNSRSRQVLLKISVIH